MICRGEFLYVVLQIRQIVYGMDAGFNAKESETGALCTLLIA